VILLVLAIIIPQYVLTVVNSLNIISSMQYWLNGSRLYIIVPGCTCLAGIASVVHALA